MAQLHDGPVRVTSDGATGSSGFPEEGVDESRVPRDSTRENITATSFKEAQEDSTAHRQEAGDQTGPSTEQRGDDDIDNNKQDDLQQQSSSHLQLLPAEGLSPDQQRQQPGMITAPPPLDPMGSGFGPHHSAPAPGIQPPPHHLMSPQSPPPLPLMSELSIGDVKVKVELRRPTEESAWPRWEVQLLDNDGASISVDTIDMNHPNQPVALSKRITEPLINATHPPHPGPMPQLPPPDLRLPPPYCDISPDGSDPTTASSGGMPGSYDEAMAAAAAAHHEGAMRGMMGGPPPYMDPSMMGPYGLGPPPPGAYDLDDGGMPGYGRPVPGGRYGPGPSHQRMGHEMQSGGQQKSLYRYYTDEEKAELKTVAWPKKIKTNGLPALWCHSCYLDKKLFKIVSPLSPKPSIVYFRHQQCNTSFHKGENLPKAIVKQYQDYYRKRGNQAQAAREAAAAANRNNDNY